MAELGIGSLQTLSAIVFSDTLGIPTKIQIREVQQILGSMGHGIVSLINAWGYLINEHCTDLIMEEHCFC